MKTIFLILSFCISLFNISLAQNISFWSNPLQHTNASIASKYLPQTERVDSWDSVSLTWNTIANMSYEYNIKGQILTLINADKNNKGIQKESFTYDDFGNRTSMTFSLRDTTTNTWFTTSRNTISYFNNTLESINQNEIWDKNTNTWRLVFRNTKLYTPQNDIYLFKIEQINNADTNITLGEKTDYTYDAAQRKTQATVVKYNTNTKTWDSTIKSDYLYHTNGLLEHQIIALYDTTQGIWMKIKKQSYAYDAQDTLIKVSTYQYNPIDETWMNRELYDDIKWITWNRNVDEQDNIASYVYKNWSDVSNNYDTIKTYQKLLLDNFGSYELTTLGYENHKLIPEQQFTKLFDDQKNKLYYQIKNGINGQWSNFYEEKSEYTYGNNKELLERLDWYFNFNINALEIQSRSVFGNHLILGLNSSTNKHASIFPNPSNGELFITDKSIESIAVYTLNGQKIVEEKPIEGKIKLNLPKGIYTIKLKSNTTTLHEKIIIN